MSTASLIMDCPKCGKVTNLTNSRYIGNSVQRFRHCPGCNYKFETYEVPKNNVKEASEYLQIE